MASRRVQAKQDDRGEHDHGGDIAEEVEVVAGVVGCGQAGAGQDDEGDERERAGRQEGPAGEHVIGAAAVVLTEGPHGAEDHAARQRVLDRGAGQRDAGERR